MKRFEDSICVVTGGTYGIGYAVARRLLEEGGRVVICSRDVRNVEKACAELTKVGKAIEGMALDIADRAAVDEFAGQVAARHGHVDVLVNNAFSQVGGTVARSSDEQWMGNFAATLHGTFFVSRAMLPLMRGRSAAIVNVSSLSGSLVVLGTAAYGAAKAGIEHLGRVLAIEEAANGVRCNCVVVGGVATPALDKLVHGNYESIAKNIPIGRVADPREIAAVVAFLASADASYVTAATIRADGGLGAVMHQNVDQSSYAS